MWLAMRNAMKIPRSITTANTRRHTPNSPVMSPITCLMGMRLTMFNSFPEVLPQSTSCPGTFPFRTASSASPSSRFSERYPTMPPSPPVTQMIRSCRNFRKDSRWYNPFRSSSMQRVANHSPPPAYMECSTYIEDPSSLSCRVNRCRFSASSSQKSSSRFR